MILRVMRNACRRWIPADRETIAVAQIDVVRPRRCAPRPLDSPRAGTVRAARERPGDRAEPARHSPASAATRRADRVRPATDACRPPAAADNFRDTELATSSSVPSGPISCGSSGGMCRAWRRNSSPRVFIRPSSPQRAAGTCSVITTRTDRGHRRSTRARSTQGILSSDVLAAVSRSTERNPAPRNGATAASIWTGATRWNWPPTSTVAIGRSSAVVAPQITSNAAMMAPDMPSTGAGCSANSGCSPSERQSREPARCTFLGLAAIAFARR